MPQLMFSDDFHSLVHINKPKTFKRKNVMKKKKDFDYKSWFLSHSNFTILSVTKKTTLFKTI